MRLTIVVGTKRYSSWSLRAWMAAFIACRDLVEINIRLRRPETKSEILKWSPSGKIPLLIDGGTRVWDSLAICEYLAERFPQAGLWPEDPAARAMARAVSAEMHAGFAALRQACSMDLLEDLPMDVVPDDVLADITRIDQLWREARRLHGNGGPYLFGRFSIADCMYAPVVTRIRTYHLPVSVEARDYCDTMMAHPAMTRWIMEAGREARAEAAAESPSHARLKDLETVLGLRAEPVPAE